MFKKLIIYLGIGLGISTPSFASFDEEGKRYACQPVTPATLETTLRMAQSALRDFCQPAFDNEKFLSNFEEDAEPFPCNEHLSRLCIDEPHNNIYITGNFNLSDFLSITCKNLYVTGSLKAPAVSIHAENALFFNKAQPCSFNIDCQGVSLEVSEEQFWAVYERQTDEGKKQLINPSYA